MPSVPRYNQPQVQQTAAPNVRVNQEASVEAFGGGQAARGIEAVRGLGNTAMDIALKEQQKADDISLAEHAAKLKQWKIDRLHNEKTGALNQKGQNAFGLPEQVGEEFSKFTSELTASAPNERVRAALGRFVQNEGLDLNEKLQVHVGREREVFDKSVTDGLVSAAQSDALLNYTNPQKVNENIQLMRGAILKNAERLGLSGAQVEQVVAESSSKVHASIIERHLNNGDDLLAKKYFDENAGNFTGQHRMAVEKALEEGSLRGDSQRMSDQIMHKFGDNMAAALEAARDIEDPKRRDATLDQLKQNYSDRRMARNQMTEDLHRNASQIIDKTGDYNKIPPAMLAQFSLSEKSALKEYARKRQSGELGTDWGAYYDLKTMAATPETRNKFLQINLHEKYRTSMEDSEFKELVNLQTSLRNGDGKSDRELDGYLSTKDIVDGALKAADLDPSPKSGSKDAELVNKFRLQVNRELKALEAKTGKKPSSDEETRIVNGLLTKAVVDKGWIWDTKKKIFEVEPGDIPKNKRGEFESALRKAGLPVNDDNLVRLYQSALRKNPNGN